jgi:hypothetical protein
MKDWFWIEAKQTFAGLTAISCATNRLTCVRASTAVANLGIADVRSCPKESGRDRRRARLDSFETSRWNQLACR